MALTVTADASTLTLNGWTDAVTIARSTASSSTPFLTVTGKFRINAGDFASLLDTGGTRGYITSVTSHTETTGSDYLGSYLEMSLTCYVQPMAASETYRLRFYDGLPVFDVLVTSGASWSGFSRRVLALTYANTQTQWFTTGLPSAWGVEAGGSTANYRDYRTGSWQASYVNQMAGGVSDGQGHHCGLPIVTENGGGAGAYVAFGSDRSYDTNCEFTTSATQLVYRSNNATAGFFVTTAHGYDTLGYYARWQQRDDKWPKSVTANKTRANAVRPTYPHAGLNFITGATTSGISYTTADLMDSVNAVHNAYPGIVGPTASVRVIECDLYWWQNNFDYQPRSATATLRATLEAAGYEPWCYVKPDHSHDWATEAAWIIAAGYKGCRFDCVYGVPATEAANLMDFRNAIKALDPGFHIETHHSYLQALCDTVRSNDWPYNSGTPGFVTGWDTALLQRLAVVSASSPGRVVDTDGLGNNSSPTDSSRTLAVMLKQARIMFGFGRPILGWMGSGTMVGGVDVFGNATMRGYFDQYEAIVARNASNPVPTHTVTGQIGTAYTSLQRWADGSTIAYDSASDVITFTSAAAVSNVSAPFTLTGSSLSVTARPGQNTTGTMTVTAPAAGTVTVNHPRLSVSLDNATWASSVSVTTAATTVYLRVAPQAGDGPIHASLGVPT